MYFSKGKKRQIRILGAGISGLVSGIILAKNNYRVEIFEKRPSVGSYFEKDIHSLRNYCYEYDVIEKYKEIGVKISNVYPIFKELRFSPSLKSVEIYSRTRPLFYNFFRGRKDKRSLDNELFKAAQQYGIKIYFNQSLSPDIEDIDIIATGTSREKGVAYGGHYKKISRDKLDSIYYFLDNHYAPQGYVYMVPFLDEFSLVIATTKIESKSQLKKRFNEMQRNNNVVRKILKDAEFENEIFGYAFFDTPKSAIRNKKLYIGEAAGFLDAATGFGTHYAILSGHLAAKAIINNENYDKLWKEYFGRELKARHSKRLRLQRLDNEDYEKMIRGLLEVCGSKILIEDYRRLTHSE